MSKRRRFVQTISPHLDALPFRPMIAALLALALVACSDFPSIPSGEASTISSAAFRETSIVSQLASRNAMGSRERTYDSVLELLPNVVIVGPEGPLGSASDAVVVGSIVEVSPGVSMKWDEVGTTRTLLPFNDAQAMSSTVHVTLQGDQVVGVGSGIELPAQVTFGLVLGARVDIEAVSAELKGLGTVVPFLFKDSAVFDYDKSLYAVVEDGGLLGVVGADGKITFPAMDPTVVPKMVPADLTIESLLALPSTPIEIQANS
ncbi:MAG: hypothetical protein ABR609_00725 [Acidimicrobiia bacterium]